MSSSGFLAFAGLERLAFGRIDTSAAVAPMRSATRPELRTASRVFAERIMDMRVEHGNWQTVTRDKRTDRSRFPRIWEKRRAKEGLRAAPIRDPCTPGGSGMSVPFASQWVAENRC